MKFKAAFFQIFAVFGFAILVGQSAWAQSWNGAAGDGLWSNGGNWSGGLPADGTAGISIAGTGAQVIDIDLANPLVAGSANLIEFGLASPGGATISGQDIEWESARIRVGSVGNEFSNNWLINNFLEVRYATNMSTITPVTISGAVSGAGQFVVHSPVVLNGDYSGSGQVRVSAVNVVSGSLEVNGTLGGSGALSVSGARLTGSGTIDRATTISSSGSNFFGSNDSTSELEFNDTLQFGSGSSRGSRLVSVRNNVSANGNVLISGNGGVEENAVLTGTGNISIGADSRFQNNGLVSGNRTISVGNAAELFGGAGGVVAAGVNVDINGGELISANTFEGAVSMQGSGRIAQGTFNGTVFASGGVIGDFNNNTIFNDSVTLLNSVEIQAGQVGGIGTISVGGVGNSTSLSISATAATEFSNTLNWSITESSVSGLGQAAAGTFFGNNVQLNASTLDGTLTNYVVAGDLTSSGDSILNQSITVNGATSINSGTLTINTGRTLNATNLVLSNGGQLINNGTLGTSNLVLESAVLDGSVNVSNGLVVRTPGVSELAAGAAVNVDGLTEVRAGTLRIESGASLGGAGDFEIANEASLDLQGAVAKDTTVLAGGTLSGVGTIEGLLAVEGNLGPGNSAGTLTVDGAVEVKDGATVAIELGGIDLGVGYDTVDGNGISSLSLDGILDVSFIDGFNAMSTDSFFVLNNFTSVTGRFENTAADELMVDGGTFDVEYGSSFVRLYNFESAVAVPEPNAFVALAICGLYASGRRRRKR